MYFPYLRGKTYELLTLRALCDAKHSALQAIHPLIEPVKAGNNTLKAAMTALSEQGVHATILVNPLVGDFQGIGVPVKFLDDQLESIDRSTVHGGIIITKKTSPTEVKRLITEHQDFATLSLYIDSAPPWLSGGPSSLPSGTYSRVFMGPTREQRIVDVFRRQAPGTELVRVDDPFPKAARNSDYEDGQPSVFSDEFRYYAQDGWSGFGDFLTIGEEFSTAGFAPRAVAIHWTYLDKAFPEATENSIMLQHFVSDTNDSIADPQGKFSQALAKLIDFAEIRWIPTTNALNEMQKLHACEHFPGLGPVKRLSMLNHIEVTVSAIQAP